MRAPTRARIDVADLGAADQLAARTPELRAALAQHGLTTDDVQVQSVAGTVVASGATDPSSDQSSRDSNPRSDGRPDDGASDRTARDGATGDRRPDDDRQRRRAAPDAYLDAPPPGAVPRSTR